MPTSDVTFTSAVALVAGLDGLLFECPRDVTQLAPLMIGDITERADNGQCIVIRSRLNKGQTYGTETPNDHASTLGSVFGIVNLV